MSGLVDAKSCGYWQSRWHGACETGHGDLSNGVVLLGGVHTFASLLLCDRKMSNTNCDTGLGKRVQG